MAQVPSSWSVASSSTSLSTQAEPFQYLPAALRRLAFTPVTVERSSLALKTAWKSPAAERVSLLAGFTAVGTGGTLSAPSKYSCSTAPFGSVLATYRVVVDGS